MGRLERHLDTDLIARIQNGWRPNTASEPLKKVKPPRGIETYRGARRNAAYEAAKKLRREIAASRSGGTR